MGVLDAVQHRLPGRGARPHWNGKLGVNAELNLTTAAGPDSELYRAVQKPYAPNIPLGSFSQMGFVEARIAVNALMSVSGEFTVKTVNEAIKNIKDFKTDILCKPWYYGDAPLHIPNNTDRTVVPQDGKMVEKEAASRSPTSTRRSHRSARSRRRDRYAVPDWQNFQPFIVTGLALGGVYALSGVGMVVLYRTTGVLNLAFGAVGAMGAFIAWSLINTYGWPEGLAYLVCVGFGAAICRWLRHAGRATSGRS